MWREPDCRHGGGGALCPSAREVANPSTHGQGNAAFQPVGTSVQTKVRPLGLTGPAINQIFIPAAGAQCEPGERWPKGVRSWGLSKPQTIISVPK